jgi:hypothetical protein
MCPNREWSTIVFRSIGDTIRRTGITIQCIWDILFTPDDRIIEYKFHTIGRFGYTIIGNRTDIQLITGHGRLDAKIGQFHNIGTLDRINQYQICNLVGTSIAVGAFHIDIEGTIKAFLGPNVTLYL